MHAIDGNAWVGSLITFVVGVVWLLQSELGLTLPSGLSHGFTTAIGYWSGPASLILLIGVLAQAAARAGMDEQREGSALSPAHIADLHRQASNYQTALVQANYYVGMNLTTVSARNFGQHFPEIAERLQSWSKEAGEWQTTLQALHARNELEALKPINGRVLQISSVMQAVAMGSYSSPLEVRWAVAQPAPGGVFNLGFHDPRTQQDITVWTIPGDANPLEFANGVQSRLRDAREWPESIRLREITTRLDGMRSGLSLDLEAIQLNHSPGGRCETCHPSK